MKRNRKVLKQVLVGLTVGMALPVTIAAGPASANLTGCTGFVTSGRYVTICSSYNNNEQYPSNQQRARMTCSSGGYGTTFYGQWVGVNVYSGAPGYYGCGGTISNTAIQLR